MIFLNLLKSIIRISFAGMYIPPEIYFYISMCVGNNESYKLEISLHETPRRTLKFSIHSTNYVLTVPLSFRSVPHQPRQHRRRLADPPSNAYPTSPLAPPNSPGPATAPPSPSSPPSAAWGASHAACPPTPSTSSSPP